MTLGDLAGRRLGPVGFAVSPVAVADFVAATGDDPRRWAEHAPPAFGAAVLFAVAPLLLADPAMTGGALIHSEQEFAWQRPLGVGEALEVVGEVEGVRSRGGRHLVRLASEASGPGGGWLRGRSSFLLVSGAAGMVAEEDEPSSDQRGACDPVTPQALPPVGSPLPRLSRSASRADLVRYAAATRDWNPIHWDHGAARAAGLPGVIVHGLLSASWLCQVAARFREGPDPLRQARVRFRLPLRPGVAAELGGLVVAVGPEGADLELTLASGGMALAAATVRVTP
jgi:acyl dehydratase